MWLEMLGWVGGKSMRDFMGGRWLIWGWRVGGGGWRELMGGWGVYVFDVVWRGGGGYRGYRKDVWRGGGGGCWKR